MEYEFKSETIDLQGTAKKLVATDLRYATSVDEMEKIREFVKQDLALPEEERTVDKNDLTYVNIQIERKIEELADPKASCTLGEIKYDVFDAIVRGLPRYENTYGIHGITLYVGYEKGERIRLILETPCDEEGGHSYSSNGVDIDEFLKMADSSFQKMLNQMYYYAEKIA